MTGRSHSVRSGLLIGLAGYIILAGGDVLVKTTTGQWPGPAFAALRYGFGAIGLAVLIAWRMGRGGFAFQKPWIQAMRGTAIATATFCFFLALQMMPIADATAISFTSPMFVALLSRMFLKDAPTPRSIAATLVAFAGVLIVLRPNIVAIGWPATLPVITAVAMSFLIIGNRLLGGTSNAVAPQFWAALIAFPILIVANLVGHFSGVDVLELSLPPVSVTIKALIVSVTATIGHMLLFLATQRASASLVSPMVYAQLMVAAVAGWLFFADPIDPVSGLGMALIVAAGLWLWAGQKRPTEIGGMPD